MHVAARYFAEELRRTVGVEAAGEWLQGLPGVRAENGRTGSFSSSSAHSSHPGSPNLASTAGTGWSVGTTSSSSGSLDGEACDESACASCDPHGRISALTSLRRQRRKSDSPTRSTGRQESSSPTRLPTSSDLAARCRPHASPLGSAKPSAALIARSPSSDGRVRRMIRSGSQNAGLMFTDAAHCCEAELASLE